MNIWINTVLNFPRRQKHGAEDVSLHDSTWVGPQHNRVADRRETTFVILLSFMERPESLKFETNHWSCSSSSSQTTCRWSARCHDVLDSLSLGSSMLIVQSSACLSRCNILFQYGEYLASLRRSWDYNWFYVQINRLNSYSSGKIQCTYIIIT